MKERAEDTEVSASASKRPWKKMKLAYLGNAVELIQGGGGKLSITAMTDPGDVRKTKGSG